MPWENVALKKRVETKNVTLTKANQYVGKTLSIPWEKIRYPGKRLVPQSWSLVKVEKVNVHFQGIQYLEKMFHWENALKPSEILSTLRKRVVALWNFLNILKILEIPSWLFNNTNTPARWTREKFEFACSTYWVCTVQKLFLINYAVHGCVLWICHGPLRRTAMLLRQCTQCHVWTTSATCFDLFAPHILGCGRFCVGSVSGLGFGMPARNRELEADRFRLNFRPGWVPIAIRSDRIELKSEPTMKFWPWIPKLGHGPLPWAKNEVHWLALSMFFHSSYRRLRPCWYGFPYRTEC